MKKLSLCLLLTGSIATTSYANTISSAVYSTDKDKQSVGNIVFTDTPFGLLIMPALKHLPAGPHGFHLHQHPNCDDSGMKAGSHYDPQYTETHQGPYGNGHLGDLPVLVINKNGTASTPILAPRLKTSDLVGLAVMIHAQGDNYTDTPALGGGGARIACGAIKE